ncbi:rubrerythrin family protein [Cryobacterium adonitolivorans]|uniref:Rubrerythrin family protein n=1 Tax=Cryobacterium adonitolivorans TaxID=1259189 RepID=A0A4R8VY20_9MICO|nr:rubrerythrin family protein [Cryobacterium adonitolivorans]
MPPGCANSCSNVPAVQRWSRHRRGQGSNGPLEPPAGQRPRTGWGDRGVRRRYAGGGSAGPQPLPRLDGGGPDRGHHRARGTRRLGALRARGGQGGGVGGALRGAVLRTRRHRPARFGPRVAGLARGSSGVVIAVADLNQPAEADIRRWRRYLADEQAEAAVYRDLAGRRTGEEREILLALAEAEGRHEAHWRDLLGDRVGAPRKGALRTRVLGLLARRFGSVFVLALAQRAEARSPYDGDADATSAMAADESIHEEVVRGLAARGRQRLSGTFRAAVFGVNDGLVSNLALVLGIGATGVPTATILFTGIAGLLAGALSMGAGEYVSVRSQRELLEASTPNPATRSVLSHLDEAANELTLVYRAQGMTPEEAEVHAREMLRTVAVATGALDVSRLNASSTSQIDEHEAIGTGMGAAISSFCFFASGALLPVLPYVFGMQGVAAIIVAAVLVGLALLATGAVVGLLSGGPPLKRALRQLVIGLGAAGVTYLLGLLFGTTVA